MDNELPVHIITADLNTDILAKEWDCAILFQSDHHTPNYNSMRLIDEATVPMARREVVDQWRGCSAEELLEHAPLIHLDDPENRWFSWKDWRDVYAPNHDMIDTTTTVTNYGVAINMAMAGHGICLGWLGVLADLNARGELIPLDFAPVTTNRAYHLLSTERFQNSPLFPQLITALLGA